MIRKTKPQADIHIPVNPSDVKLTIEVPVKEMPLEQIEKVEKPGFISKKSKRKSKENKEENIKTKDYILIITEKPQAALKIASSLGSSKKYSDSNVPYYLVERKGKRIIVACAVGHLFTLMSKEKGWPIFNIEWVENSKVKKQDWSKKYYNVLTKLVKNASEFIIATDYDIEGEVIGWNVIRFIAKEKDAKRMKFSTLTKEELENSYENLESTINWGHAYAGETRHFLDWMYGINLSRALMSAIKSQGKFKIMSIGRVQGPALNLIVKKELEIQKFKPTPYWQIFITLKGHKLELIYEKDILNKKELDKFKNLEGKKGLASTEKKMRSVNPPYPFDLTSLQREAYRFFKITPSKCLQIAQQLYLAGLISYPRTSSQKIPEAINPQSILKKLSRKFKETTLAVKKTPIEGPKSDPAHPSIYPTGEIEELESDNKKIYELIVKRFISCFCENAEIEDKKIFFITDNNLKFKASGEQIKKHGWMAVYPSGTKEVNIEDINGEKIIDKSRTEEKETQPPRRYTAASIITELEKRNLGTKATRANIIETLYDRNYIKGESIEATPLGIKLISTLEKHSPIIIDEQLTREFDEEMEAIQDAKKDLNKLEDKMLEKAKKSLIKISDDFKEKEKHIGKDLVEANQENYEKEREENKIGECPACKKGSLRILYNKLFKRYFVGCSNYPECKTTFSLPPNSIIKQTGKNCNECNFPMLMSLKKGKRPWFFCFNPQCPSRKRYEEEKKKQAEEEKKEKKADVKLVDEED